MADENKKEELKIHEQGDGSVIIGDLPPDPEVEEKDDGTVEENTLVSNDVEAKDEEGHENESPEEAEARRERNRKRRTENKERRKEYVESLKRELASRDSIIADLASRVSSVERTASTSQLAQLDNAIQDAEAQYKELQDINRQAIEQANGEVAVEAQERMFELRARQKQLADVKKNLSRQTTRPQPTDPRVSAFAVEWASKNQWFDPMGRDQDSRIAKILDNELVSEGWSPTIKEYWDELNSRIKKYLPHKAQAWYNHDKTKQIKSPVAGGGRESSNSNSTSTYRLSQDRVNAIKEAGMWDDPARRAAMIKQYQDYDKQSSN